MTSTPNTAISLTFAIGAFVVTVAVMVALFGALQSQDFQPPLNECIERNSTTGAIELQNEDINGSRYPYTDFDEVTVIRKSRAVEYVHILWEGEVGQSHRFALNETEWHQNLIEARENVTAVAVAHNGTELGRATIRAVKCDEGGDGA